jgi:uncharacterized membrane protein
MKYLAFWRHIGWRLLAIFVLVAAIAHIVATFLAVSNQSGTAYARLANVLPQNTMTISDPVSPHHEPLAYLAPDARYAFCPFNTADTTMRVKAVLPDVGWTIGIYAPDGTSLYFAAASADRETTIDLSIVPADDRFLGLPRESAEQQAVDADQTISAPKGLIVVRAPDRGEPYRDQARAMLAKASCVARRT